MSRPLKWSLSISDNKSLDIKSQLVKIIIAFGYYTNWDYGDRFASIFSFKFLRPSLIFSCFTFLRKVKDGFSYIEVMNKRKR